MDRDDIILFIKEVIEDATGDCVENDTLLFEEEVLDSMSILNLIEELEEKYDISLPLDEVQESNYSTVEVIADYVESKLS